MEIKSKVTKTNAHPDKTLYYIFNVRRKYYVYD